MNKLDYYYKTRNSLKVSIKEIILLGVLTLVLTLDFHLLLIPFYIMYGLLLIRFALVLVLPDKYVEKMAISETNRVHEKLNLEDRKHDF